jgi:hypothetical protein
MTKWLVYVDGKVSRCVPEGSAEAKSCAGDSMSMIFDGARSRFDGWTYAAVHFGCIPDDYDDDMKPGIISAPQRLYRSVSIHEMDLILDHGSIKGGGNRFNSFDRRPFVFFAGALNEQCIGQAEDATRIAEYLAADIFQSRGHDMRRDRGLLREIYRDCLEAERTARNAMSFSSCVIETAPISVGFHYSLENGATGMNGDDEFGLFPGQVSVAMIERVHWVKDGKVTSETAFDDAASVLMELKRERSAELDQGIALRL